jgi:hypothetical protein
MMPYDIKVKSIITKTTTATAAAAAETHQTFTRLQAPVRNSVYAYCQHTQVSNSS